MVLLILLETVLGSGVPFYTGSASRLWPAAMKTFSTAVSTSETVADLTSTSWHPLGMSVCMRADFLDPHRITSTHRHVLCYLSSALCRSVHIEKCSRCVLVLGAVSSTVVVSNSDSLTIVTACRKIHVRLVNWSVLTFFVAKEIPYTRNTIPSLLRPNLQATSGYSCASFPQCIVHVCLSPADHDTPPLAAV